MMRWVCAATLVSAIFLSLLAARARGGGHVPQVPRQAPVVVLALDGSGDFGPQTPGTRTSGWQEALDYCVAHRRDLYVQGGYGGGQIYNIQDTIHVPPAQDFRIDGGIYVINWIGPPDRDLMTIDSTMNCEYHFGLMVYGGRGIGLHIRPERPVPVDNFPVCVETRIEMEGLADPHPFVRGERVQGEGLVLDGTNASIVHSEFRMASVINFHTCMRTVGAVGYNHIICPHLHTNADRSTLFVGDERLAANTISLTIGVDQGAEAVTGMVISGRDNVVELAQRESDRPFPPHRSLILESSAEGNQVNLVCPPLADPAIMITDRAQTPTNQITWAGPPPAIRIIRAAPGVFVYTQRLWPATVSIDGGKVTNFQLTRGSQRVARNPRLASQTLLSPGDRLTFRSASWLRLVIVPVKVR